MLGRRSVSALVGLRWRRVVDAAGGGGEAFFVFVCMYIPAASVSLVESCKLHLLCAAPSLPHVTLWRALATAMLDLNFGILLVQNYATVFRVAFFRLNAARGSKENKMGSSSLQLSLWR